MLKERRVSSKEKLWAGEGCWGRALGRWKDWERKGKEEKVKDICKSEEIMFTDGKEVCKRKERCG